MLADLEGGTLTRVLRPTLLSALFAGVIAVGVALLLGSAPAAAGIVLGVGVAVLNLRMLAAGVARIETEPAQPAAAAPDGSAPPGGPASADGSVSPDTKVVRRILRTRSA